MFTDIRKFLTYNKVTKLFLASPSPRWVVLCVDLAITAFACLVTYGLSPTAELAIPGWWGEPFAQAIGVFIVYALTMSFARTYKYIVRISVLEDMFQVVLLVASASCILFILALVTWWTMGYAYFGVWNVFVVGLLVFTIMMFTRLSIKYVYRQLVSKGLKRRRVIALGSSVDSFAYATALNDEASGEYRIVAMLSLTPHSSITSINNIPVLPYDKDKIEEYFHEYDSNCLIFPSGQLKFMRSGVVDDFLRHHIQLLMYSQVREIDNATGLERSAGNVRNIRIEDLLGRDVIQPDTSNVEKVLKKQVVMITGAAGSIGSEIVNQVAQMQAEEIVLVDQAETPMHELQLLMEQNHPEIKIHLFIGDVSNRSRMEQAFIKYHPRYVFHAAAYKHVPMMERNPYEAIMTNVFGTKILADLAVKYGIEKFVMVSTDKAVNPTNIMGASKRIAEIYVQSLFYHLRHSSDINRTAFITTRFGNVLGSNGSVIPLFRKQIENGGPITLTHRDIIRYFMTIPEACSLVLQAATIGDGGEIFVFDMGQPVKIFDLAMRMISISGLKPFKDIDIIETGLRPGEKLYEELLNDKETTMATRNDKIMIAKVRVYQYEEVMQHLETLHKATTDGDYHDIVVEMKRLVPEFISQNSAWEKIDKEIKDGKDEESLSEIQGIQ